MMTCAIAGSQSSHLVLPFQTEDTLILDPPAARAVRERLKLHTVATHVLRGQGIDRNEAFRIVSRLTDDELRTFVHSPT